MQISATTAAQNLQFYQSRRASFKYQQSPLNPNSTTSSCSSTTTELTRTHLSNLDKLLQKQNPGHGPQQDNLKQPETVRGSSSVLSKRGNNLLEGLNLKRIWPEMKAAEQMSPRNLNRLQRLLSLTPEYSPRNNLASRWLEYHGCNDWDGMLDPLDENLRREIVRYGEFVQAAYHAFHSNPAMSAEEVPLPQHVALPDRAYRVTRSLYATSSVGLPKWVDDMAPDLRWMTQRSSWMGYVAVCEDKREIQRMGRRDIVIALRGTATCLEWTENMRAQLVSMPRVSYPDQAQPKVECGFLSLYKTRGSTHVPSLAETVVQEVRRLVELYKDETLSITITGHSLGAALALLVAEELSTCAPNMPPIAVFSFGSPRVGNKGFANQVNAKNIKVLRIVNTKDVITKVPGLPMLEGLDSDMPLAYSHVGVELRVHTKMSPYLKPDADVACCHDLEAYLHLVDGFLASDSPFRANAKRSLVKLLSEQRSNVKKLYTSKTLSPLNLVKQISLATSGCLPSPN